MFGLFKKKKTENVEPEVKSAQSVKTETRQTVKTESKAEAKRAYVACDASTPEAQGKIRSVARIFSLGVKEDMTMVCPLDATKKIIALINFFIWDKDDQNFHEDTRKVMREHGFSEKNRLSAEWVVKNIDKAYVVGESINQGLLLFIHSRYDKLYDDLIAKGA